MNKQQATVELACVRIKHKEMKRKIVDLKAIIDAPEPKIGRVMSVDDLNFNSSTYYFIVLCGELKTTTYDGLPCELFGVNAGQWFHDKTSCEQYIEYLKLEQELRVAQIESGGDGEHQIEMYEDGSIIKVCTNKTSRVSFKSVVARNIFHKTYTSEQLKLLIRGV